MAHAAEASAAKTKSPELLIQPIGSDVPIRAIWRDYFRPARSVIPIIFMAIIGVHTTAASIPHVFFGERDDSSTVLRYLTWLSNRR